MDPREKGPKPPHATTNQEYPGMESEMDPKPDYGEKSYKGSGKLKGKAAVITGGDSGIGRAVALAFAREGADVLISYLSEESDAKETARVVEAAGRKCVTVAGDISEEAHCQAIIDRAVKEFGKVDILVNNAAFQMSRERHRGDQHRGVRPDAEDEPLRHVLADQGGRPAHAQGRRGDQHLVDPGRQPEPAAAALRDDQGGDPELHRRPGPDARQEGHPGQLRRPGPDLDAADPGHHAARRRSRTSARTWPWGVPGQPAELAPVFVLLASDDSSYMAGATVAVTGGKPLI